MKYSKGTETDINICERVLYREILSNVVKIARVSQLTAVCISAAVEQASRSLIDLCN